MSFTVYNLGQVCCGCTGEHDFQIKIGTGIFDGVLVAVISMLAALILASHAGHVHLPGLASITNLTAYILLGLSGGVALLDMVTFALLMCQKPKTEENLPAPKLQEDSYRQETIHTDTRPFFEIAIQEGLEQPCLDRDTGKILISSEHQKMLELDLLKNLVDDTSKNLPCSKEVRVDNIGVLLDPKINKIFREKCKRPRLLKRALREISGNRSEPSIFLCVDLTTACRNLIYVRRMSDPALKLFWLEAFRYRLKSAQIDRDFDALEAIFASSLVEIEEVSEMLFAYLLANHNSEKAQFLLSKYPKSLKMRRLKLEQFRPLMGKEHEQNRAQVDQFFAILDVSTIQCLVNDYSDKNDQYKHIHVYQDWNDCYKHNDVDYILGKCCFLDIQHNCAKNKNKRVIDILRAKNEIRFIEFTHHDPKADHFIYACLPGAGCEYIPRDRTYLYYTPEGKEKATQHLASQYGVKFRDLSKGLL